MTDDDESPGLSCHFGPKPCRSGVCLHYGYCMATDAEDAGQSVILCAAPSAGEPATPPLEKNRA